MLHDSQPDDVTPPTVQVDPASNPNRHASGFRPAMRTPPQTDPELPHPADSEPATILEAIAPGAGGWEEEPTTSKIALGERHRLLAESTASEAPPPREAVSAPARPHPPSGAFVAPRLAPPSPLAPSLSTSPQPPRVTPASQPSQPSASPAAASHPSAAFPGPSPAYAAPSQPSGVHAYTPSAPFVAPQGAFGGSTPSGAFHAAGHSATWSRPATGAPPAPSSGTTLAVVAVLAFVLGMTAGLAAGVAVGMRLL